MCVCVLLGFNPSTRLFCQLPVSFQSTHQDLQIIFRASPDTLSLGLNVNIDKYCWTVTLKIKEQTSETPDLEDLEDFQKWKRQT